MANYHLTTNTKLMDYPLSILEKEKRTIEKSIKQADLLHKNMQAAAAELRKLSQLTQAIKCLKQKHKLLLK